MEPLVALPRSPPDSAVESLVLELFAGIGGGRHALGDLALASHTRIVSFETAAHARAVLGLHDLSGHAEVSLAVGTDGLPGSVLALTDRDCLLLRGLIDSAPNLRSVLVVAGSPCQGFSRANPHRLGIEDERSRLVWTVAVVVARARAHLTAKASKATVHFVLENVVLDGHDLESVDTLMGVRGRRMDAGDLSPCRRPRTYWTSLPPAPLPLVDIDPAQVLPPQWAPVWLLAESPPNHGRAHRWACATRPWGPGAPPELPLPFPHYSAGAYSAHGLAVADEFSHRSELVQLVRALEAAPTLAARRSARLQLAEAVHSPRWLGLVRPLSPEQIEACLGYPPGASVDPGRPLADQFWDRLGALGNGFSVTTVSFVLRPWVAAALAGSVLSPLPGGPTALDEASAMAALRSGGPGRRRVVPPATARALS